LAIYLITLAWDQHWVL